MFTNTFSFVFFFFNDTATTEIYTLSLHDALPIFQNPIISIVELRERVCVAGLDPFHQVEVTWRSRLELGDRKSTRLNSSHSQISYAVFCLKKKKRESNCFTISSTGRAVSPSPLSH